MGAVCTVERGPGGTLAVGLSRGGQHWAWHGRLAELHGLHRDIGTTAADLLSGFTWFDAAFVNSMIRAHVAGFGQAVAVEQ